MSKIKDYSLEHPLEVIGGKDNGETPHWCHQSFHQGCEECRKEVRLTNAYKLVNHPIDCLSAITGIKLLDMLGK